MSKLDIAQNELYIKKIINVLKSEIKDQKNKPIFVNSRHSDALVYVLSGSCTYFFEDGREITAQSGGILYLAKGAIYKMNLKTNCYKFIYTDFEFGSDSLRKSDYYNDIANAENMFSKLVASNKESFAEGMAALYSIYAEICNKKKETSKSRFEIIEAKEYIEKNFSNLSLGVDTLAERCNMSEVYFRRLFKNKFGMPPSQYIILTRVEHSKKLLVHTFLTLETCATQSGFSSLQYYCRVFKKATGITPGQWRKTM